MGRAQAVIAALMLALPCAGRARADFILTYQIENVGGQFNPAQVQLLEAALIQAKSTWESVITGYSSPATIPQVLVHIWPTNVGLAAGTYNGVLSIGGFDYATGGDIFVNVLEVDNFANWQGAGANGLNFLDELLVHETGHVLGIGTLWTENGDYIPLTYQYTGTYGLAAYRAEFDPTADWVPVENAGELGTAGSHWNQRMRSSASEGNPADPWSLDPRVGIVDPFGRDIALEVMTGAIDPDYGEPFLSRTTVESMRDLGYVVSRFEDSTADGLVDEADLAVWTANFGSIGLQMDSVALGDADRDRAVAGGDFLLWQQAYGSDGKTTVVPEPASTMAIAIAWAFTWRAVVASSRRAGMHQAM